MSTSSEFAGKMLEKPSFSQTCSMLSQYLKENKAALGGGKPEIFRQIVTPMNLFPEKPIADSTRKADPAQILKSMDLFPQFADSSAKMSDEAEVAKAAQMTIFYGGQVIVFDDFPADKAKEVMLLAGKGSSSQGFSPQPTLAPKIPNNQVESNPMGVPPDPIQDRIPRPVEPIASDLPIARRNSLHRFLEKRKDRITSKSPYPVAAATSAPSNPAENKPWLSLAASQ